PAGWSMMLPVPSGVTLVWSVIWTELRLKVTSTLRSRSSVTLQAPLPLQAPPQPAKVELPAGVAPTVTWVPGGNASVQPEAQGMPVAVALRPPAPRKLMVRRLTGPLSGGASSGRSLSASGPAKASAAASAMMIGASGRPPPPGETHMPPEQVRSLGHSPRGPQATRPLGMAGEKQALATKTVAMTEART